MDKKEPLPGHPRTPQPCPRPPRHPPRPLSSIASQQCCTSPTGSRSRDTGLQHAEHTDVCAAFTEHGSLGGRLPAEAPIRQDASFSFVSMRRDGVAAEHPAAAMVVAFRPCPDVQSDDEHHSAPEVPLMEATSLLGACSRQLDRAVCLFFHSMLLLP